MKSSNILLEMLQFWPNRCYSRMCCNFFRRRNYLQNVLSAVLSWPSRLRMPLVCIFCTVTRDKYELIQRAEYLVETSTSERPHTVCTYLRVCLASRKSLERKEMPTVSRTSGPMSNSNQDRRASLDTHQLLGRSSPNSWKTWGWNTQLHCCCCAAGVFSEVVGCLKKSAHLPFLPLRKSF